MTISLKQMRYAIAVAREGHFGRAAETCSVSQPALSQQILALEELCGTPLFDRLKTGTRLTPFGRDFVALAQDTVKSAEALDDFALGRSGRLDRPLRFGLIPTVAPYLLPRIYPALTRNLPEISFSVSESRTETMLGALHDGRLDIALIASEPPPGGPRLATRPLFDDPFVLATPRAGTSTNSVANGSAKGRASIPPRASARRSVRAARWRLSTTGRPYE